MHASIKDSHIRRRAVYRTQVYTMWLNSFNKFSDSKEAYPVTVKLGASQNGPQVAKTESNPFSNMHNSILESISTGDQPKIGNTVASGQKRKSSSEEEERVVVVVLRRRLLLQVHADGIDIEHDFFGRKHLISQSRTSMPSVYYCLSKCFLCPQ